MRTPSSEWTRSTEGFSGAAQASRLSRLSAMLLRTPTISVRALSMGFLRRSSNRAFVISFCKVYVVRGFGTNKNKPNPYLVLGKELCKLRQLLLAEGKWQCLERGKLVASLVDNLPQQCHVDRMAQRGNENPTWYKKKKKKKRRRGRTKKLVSTHRWHVLCLAAYLWNVLDCCELKSQHCSL